MNEYRTPNRLTCKQHNNIRQQTEGNLVFRYINTPNTIDAKFNRLPPAHPLTAPHQSSSLTLNTDSTHHHGSSWYVPNTIHHPHTYLYGCVFLCFPFPPLYLYPIVCFHLVVFLLCSVRRHPSAYGDGDARHITTTTIQSMTKRHEQRDSSPRRHEEGAVRDRERQIADHLCMLDSTHCSPDQLARSVVMFRQI